VVHRSEFVEALITRFRQTCIRPDLSIAEQIQLFVTAATHLAPEAAENLWSAWIAQSNRNVVELAFHWRALAGEHFPNSLPHFRESGRSGLRLIQRVAAAYEAAPELSALPFLIRFVDTVIRGIKKKRLDITSIGSHASLLNEFIHKAQEPLPGLSPTAAVLHFNLVQNIAHIPKKTKSK
jgi:hypothetical protein